MKAPIVYLVLITLLLQLCSTQCANILFIAVTPSVSHQKPFQVIWKELALRGHDVHVLSPSPLLDPSIKNLTEYDLSAFYQALNKRHESNPETARYLLKKPDFLTVFVKDAIMTGLWSILQESTFKHEETQKLLKKNLKFDVAIVEWLYPTMAAFGAYYDCPIIGISSLGAPIPALDTLGNPSHPVIAPDHNLPVSRDLNFRERLMSGLWAVYVRIYYHLVVLPREDKLAKKYLGQDIPYLGDIEKNISLLLLNRNPVFHRPMPMFPAIVELGGIRFNKTVQDLDLKLKKFLNKSTQGVIYFSLGSNIKSTFLSESTLETLKTAFGKLPYNVVWKWEDDDIPGKPENVFISKWLPQVALLDHPNVKLFITQGGLQSIEEAVVSHVPIIGIPFPSDQTTNVATCVKFGMGLQIDLEDITVEKFNALILEIINNPSYKENAKKLANLMYDQPQDGLQKAVWWIEHVIRHKGARHLRSVAVDMAWWKYLMLDIIGAVLALLSVIALVLYFLIKILCLFVFKICRLLIGNKKTKKNKNKKE